MAGCCAGRVGLPERSQEPDAWFGTEQANSRRLTPLRDRLQVTCSCDPCETQATKATTTRAPGSAGESEPETLRGAGAARSSRQLASTSPRAITGPTPSFLGFFFVGCSCLCNADSMISKLKFRCFSVRVSFVAFIPRFGSLRKSHSKHLQKKLGGRKPSLHESRGRGFGYFGSVIQCSGAAVRWCLKSMNPFAAGVCLSWNLPGAKTGTGNAWVDFCRIGSPKQGIARTVSAT